MVPFPLRSLLPLLAALVASWASSCAATSVPYHFEPSPAEVQVDAPGGGPTLARVYLGVVGGERQGGSRSGHPDLLVRLRIEAKGPGAVRFDPATAKVLGPDLALFGPARVDGHGAGSIEVARGEARDLTLRFAFPRDAELEMPRLTGVNVGLTLETPAGPRELSVSLSRSESWRRDRYRHYDYGYGYPYSPGWQWHFGYVYHRGC